MTETSIFGITIVAVMFLAEGISSTLISGMHMKELGTVFGQGIVTIFPAVIMILMASSIRYTLEEAKVLDTILFGAVGLAETLATSVFIGAVMLIFGRQIIGAFISVTPEEMTEATKVGYTYLSIMSVCLPVLYVLHVTRSAVQGVGNTVLPMVSGVAEFVMRTGGVLLLPALIGENGIFITEVMAWAGADMILIPSYFITLKKFSE